MPKLMRLTAAPARSSLNIEVGWDGLRLHAGWCDDRSVEADGIEAAAHQAGRLRLLDERGDIGERGRLVFRHRDGGGGTQERVVEHARAGDFRSDAGKRLAAERHGVAFSGEHRGKLLVGARELELDR